MKSVLILAIALFTGFNANAQSEEVRIERSRAVTPLIVELNANTVRCLLGDYSLTSLKISLPDLRGITLFRQTTAGETAPCINAGSCRFDKAPDGRQLDPSLILIPDKPTEEIQLTVVLEEVLDLDAAAKSCSRYLEETISSTVRGIPFRHVDGGPAGNLDYDLCMRMKP